MENLNPDLDKNTVGFGLSVAITSIISLALVLYKETHEGFLNWMKAVTVHHWVTHGLIDIILFVAIGLILSKAGGGKGIRMSANALGAIITLAIVVSYVAIAAFYLFEG